MKLVTANHQPHSETVRLHY